MLREWKECLSTCNCERIQSWCFVPELFDVRSGFSVRGVYESCSNCVRVRSLFAMIVWFALWKGCICEASSRVSYVDECCGKCYHTCARCLCSLRWHYMSLFATVLWCAQVWLNAHEQLCSPWLNVLFRLLKCSGGKTVRIMFCWSTCYTSYWLLLSSNFD